MAHAWFILGQSPLVSLAELAGVYGPLEEGSFFAPAARLRVPIPVTSLATLGGSIKVGSEVATTTAHDTLATVIAREIHDQDTKVTFGISVYGQNITASLCKTLGIDVKKLLTARGLSARFVDTRGLPALSSASVTYNGLLNHGNAEFLVIETSPNTFAVAKTTAVQPFADLSERDYGRPGRDDKSGMLPPKVAMMMLNIGGADKTKTILDPFCGSGTVLTEALERGFTSIVGADISPVAVRDAEKNITWTAERKKLPVPEHNLFVYDVRQLADKLLPRSIDCIITEPYMGKPLRGNETIEALKKSATELAELYTEAFVSFTKFLKPGGTVVFVIPRFVGHAFTVTIADKIMPRLTELGFHKTRLLPDWVTPTSYVLYQRAGQRVAREIWKFTYKT